MPKNSSSRAVTTAHGQGKGDTFIQKSSWQTGGGDSGSTSHKSSTVATSHANSGKVGGDYPRYETSYSDTRQTSTTIRTQPGQSYTVTRSNTTTTRAPPAYGSRANYYVDY